MRSARSRIVVVGSLNIDYIASVRELPTPGQTVGASRLIRRFGGKGANQAVAAARQGAQVVMMGCVGADDEGRRYREQLKREGIDTAFLLETPTASTGTALIAVDQQGENFIIVSPGANAHLRPERLGLLKALQGPPPAAVLLQFEIPMLTIRAFVRWANRARVPVILNPSPFQQGFPWGRCSLESLIVNAGEAKAVFQLDPDNMGRQLSAWRKALAHRRLQQLVVTRGARPTLCVTASDFLQIPVPAVKPIDTVGAGDAFAGAFAAYRADGLDPESAIRLANCAGSLATLKPGAQEAIPSRQATQRALRRLRFEG